jgi:hypothetical protein
VSPFRSLLFPATRSVSVFAGNCKSFIYRFYAESPSNSFIYRIYANTPGWGTHHLASHPVTTRHSRFARPLFSCSYKSLFSQLLSLHIHTKPPRVYPLRSRSASLCLPARRKALTPFRMNTCKSVSKQKTLSTCTINTYAKTGGGGHLCDNSALSAPPRYHFLGSASLLDCCRASVRWSPSI